MLTGAQLQNLLADLHISRAGRLLIEEARREGPARTIERRTDTVRTSHFSHVMGDHIVAESRTVELAAILLHEHAAGIREIWPQPFSIDLEIAGPTGGRTRIQHTPDLLLIFESEIVVEEWREEKRLQRLAKKSPHRYRKDEQGLWHDAPAEAYFKDLGITYRLCSADELPRILLANISFLHEYNKADARPVPDEIAVRVQAVIAERKVIPYLQLIYDHHFDADHIWKLISDGALFAELHEQRLDQVDDLLLFRDRATYRAHALLGNDPGTTRPASTLELRVGTRFDFDGRQYEVAMLGTQSVAAKDAKGTVTTLPISVVADLFHAGSIEEQLPSRTVEADFALVPALADSRKLEIALTRLDAIQNPDASGLSRRQIRRYAKRIAGAISRSQQLEMLLPNNLGNRAPRLPEKTVTLAMRAIGEHNKPRRQKTSATFALYVTLCDDAGVKPMSQPSFYRLVKQHEDILAREGRRAAYQKAPIQLTFDYEHPVHGVRPHEVVYIDHTTVNQFLKGRVIPNLGKPYLSIAVDGAVGSTRAMYLSFDAPSANVVLMVLRDYVRRNGRLPKTIVLDNGSEFHSAALKLFCRIFQIDIRWRRRSRPRDSSMVERMLGATEQELISALDGNTIALKDPRMVSSSVHPDNFVKWTLPGLHGAIEHYLFEHHPSRIHPRCGETLRDRENRLIRELGAQPDTMMVRYDATLRLMTAPHSGTRTRKVDRQRGVFVDGMFYWNDKLARARPGERVEVRVEMWCARIVYVHFRDEWLVAQARDGRRLEGRFRHEFEIAKRAENRAKRRLAHADRRSTRVSRDKVKMFIPERWDPRLREQAMEAHYLYESLGMAEVWPEVRSPKAQELDPGADEAPPATVYVATGRSPGVSNAQLTPTLVPQIAADSSPAPASAYTDLVATSSETNKRCGYL